MSIRLNSTARCALFTPVAVPGQTWCKWPGGPGGRTVVCDRWQGPELRCRQTDFEPPCAGGKVGVEGVQPERPVCGVGVLKKEMHSERAERWLVPCTHGGWTRGRGRGTPLHGDGTRREGRARVGCGHTRSAGRSDTRRFELWWFFPHASARDRCCMCPQGGDSVSVSWQGHHHVAAPTARPPTTRESRWSRGGVPKSTVSTMGSLSHCAPAGRRKRREMGVGPDMPGRQV